MKLTAERERNLRRDHERMHPEGLTKSGRVCDICLLLAALKETHRRIPRCSGFTHDHFRCAQGAGHLGPHSHPQDGPKPSQPIHGISFFEHDPDPDGEYDSKEGQYTSWEILDG